jgi:hypothetical protein
MVDVATRAGVLGWVVAMKERGFLLKLRHKKNPADLAQLGRF